MINVDRAGKTAALRALAERAGEEIAKGRPVVIFPEGTRRTPGAAPAYQSGIALLYRTLGVPVVPVAVNSGLYWPRRSFLHYPGTIIVEFLPPIPPGLESRAFLDGSRRPSRRPATGCWPRPTAPPPARRFRRKPPPA